MTLSANGEREKKKNFCIFLYSRKKLFVAEIIYLQIQCVFFGLILLFYILPYLDNAICLSAFVWIKVQLLPPPPALLSAKVDLCIINGNICWLTMRAEPGEKSKIINSWAHADYVWFVRNLQINRVSKIQSTVCLQLGIRSIIESASASINRC